MGIFTKRFFKAFVSLLLLVPCISIVNAQVSVTATAGTTGPTSYSTVNAAFTAINAGTHQGVITVSITGNTTEPSTSVPLLKSSSPSSYTSITIRPSGGNWTVNSAASPTASRGVIELHGADNVTIDGDDPGTSGTRNLTFLVATSTSTGIAAIRLASTSTSGTDGGDNLTVKNCIITGSRSSATSTTTNYGIVMSNSSSITTGAYSSINTTIENNVITRCYEGIYANGSSSTYPNTGLQILSNTIGTDVGGFTDATSVGHFGIFLAYTATSTGSALVRGNDIRGGGSSGYSGLVSAINISAGNYGVVIERNNIHDLNQPSSGGYGPIAIYYSSGTSNTLSYIRNNFITRLTGYTYTTTATGVWNAYGIYTTAAVTNLNIDFNTFAFNVAQAGSTSNAGFSCIVMNSSSATIASLRNNIFYNTLTSTNSYCIYTSATAIISGGTVDNNDFYAPSANVGYYNGAARTTLTDWQSATSKDGNSKNVDPGFVSSSDFHISTSGTGAPTLNSAGVTISGITNDFDGDSRTGPDIGADEFTLAGCVSATGGTSSVTGGATGCVGGTKSFTNTGATSGTGATYQWQVSTVGGGVGFSNVSGGSGATTTSYTTGTLSAGTYYYRMVATCANCGPCSNPSTEVSISVVSPASVSISPASPNVCGVTGVSITASGAVSYSWSPSAGLSATNVANPTATPSSSTTYTVTGTDANSCTATASKLVNVFPGVTVSSTTATPSAICSGNNSQLNTTASVSAAYTMNSNSGVSFVDISGTGTSLGAITDDGEYNITIPSFTFGGTAYTSARVGANGAIVFGATTGEVYFGNATLPSTANTAGNVFLAPYWDDLDVNLSGLIYTQTVGSLFIIQYNAFDHNLYTTGTITFQVQLNTSTGAIHFVYNDVVFGSASYDGGLTATVGIQTSSSYAVQYSSNTTSLTNGQSITFTPYAPSLGYSWSNTGGFITGSTTVANPLAVAVTSTTPYTVTVTDANSGCSATGSVTVTISATSLSASAAATVNPLCAGASTTVSVTPSGGCAPFNYAWSNGAGNVASFSATPTTTTTYTVTVTDNASTTATANVIVTVNSSPTVVITPTPASGNLCGSGSVSLSASGANTYSWSSGSGNPNVVSPSSTTVYTVTGTDGNSCTATATRTVIVYPGPTATASATPSTVCSGNNSQLSATGAIATVTYTMNTNSGVSFVDISTTGTSVGALSDDGEYNVTIPSFSFGGTTYTTARIGNNGAIAFGTTSGNIAAVNATLPSTSNTAGNAFIAPYWSDLYTAGAIYTQTVGSVFIIQYNGINDFDYPTGFITFQAQLNTSTGAITFAYPDVIYGSSTYDAGAIATVGIQTSSSYAVQYSYNTASLTNGQSITFTPYSTTFNYSWSNTGGFITGSTTISNPLAVGVTTTTPYTVTVTDATSGCTATASTSISIATGSMSASISPSPASLCSGQSTTLTASAAGGSTPLTYAWSTSETSSAITKSPTTTTTYSVTVTDACGTTASASVSIAVTTTPTVSITSNPANAIICGSGSVQLTASGATSYSWSSGSGNPNTVSPTSTTTYTVTGTTSGCTATATKTVTVASVPTASASATPPTVCVGSNSQLNVSASVPGTYNVNSNSGVAFVDISSSGTSVGTVADDSEHNITIPAFTFYGTSYTTARIGNNGVVVFGTTTGDIIYTNSALPQGIATGTTATSGIITGTGNSLAAIAPLWDDMTTSGSVTTSIKTQQIGNVFYIQWTDEDNYNATGTGTITFQVQLNTSTGAITFVYSDVSYGASGFDNGASATIGIQQNASNAVQYSFNSASVTNGQSITFTPAAQPSFTYSWSPSTFISGQTTLQNPVATSVTSSLAYTVTVTNPSTGCTASSNVSLTTTSLPGATASNTGPYNLGDNILLDAGNVPSATYSWSGPNAFTSTTEDPSITGATTANAGVYTVTVTGSNTCTASASTTVVVSAPNTYTWTGSVSTAWGTAGNWAGGVVPPNNCGSYVVIPNTTNKPIVTSAVTVGNITLGNWAIVTLNANLSVCGNVTAGSSSSQFTGLGTLRLVGTSAQTISGRLNADNILVNNSSGVQLSAGAVLNLYEILDLQSGNLTTTAATLLLKSSSAKTALIKNQGSAAIVGAITMERMLTGFWGYHHLSSPVIDATAAQWGDDFAIKGTNGINASTYKQEGTLQEYRESQNGTNLLDSGYYNYTNLLSALNSGKGYTAIVYPSLIETQGTPGNGNIPVTITKTGAKVTAGWNFVGNPYPSPISWSSFRDAATNAGKMAGSCYIWKSTGGGYRNGSWVTYNGVTGVGGVGNIIGSHQAFWVQTSLNSTTVTFSNSNRTTDLSPVFQKYQQQQPDEVRLELSKDGILLNEIVAYSSPTASDEFDYQEDALMPDNKGNEFAFDVNAEKYLIDVTGEITKDKVLPLHIDVMDAGLYRITNTTNNTLNADMFLYDENANTYTDINDKSVDLVLNAGSSSSYSIVFKKITPISNVASVQIYSIGNRAVVKKADDGLAEVKIYNALGQVISSVKGTNSQFVIPVGGVESGIFTVLVITEGKSYTQNIYIANR